MKIKDILVREDQNSEKIFLFREGYFFRAYNRSAMRFSQNVKSVKILKKYIKYLETDIFYCGVPKNCVEEIKRISEKNGWGSDVSEDLVVIFGVPVLEEDFEGWKAQIPAIEPIAKNNVSRKKEAFILKKLKDFPIDEKTPHEAIRFVYELQELMTIFGER